MEGWQRRGWYHVVRQAVPDGGSADREGPAADGRPFHGQYQQTIGPSRADRTSTRQIGDTNQLTQVWDRQTDWLTPDRYIDRPPHATRPASIRKRSEKFNVKTCYRCDETRNAEKVFLHNRRAASSSFRARSPADGRSLARCCQQSLTRVHRRGPAFPGLSSLPPFST